MTETSRTAQSLMLYEAQKRSLGVSYLLWFFLGLLGGHRFYNGKWPSGLLLLLTTLVGWATTFIVIGLLPLAVAGLWVLIDALLIPGWVQRHNERLALRLGR